METLLPFLQMRAQMMHDTSARLNLQNNESRQRFTSTASSLPSSPTTPLSPSSPFFSWATGNNGLEPTSPFLPHSNSSQSLYLSQLAAINLQLQQRRLLQSSSESPSAIHAADDKQMSPRDKKPVFTFDNINVDNDDINVDSIKSEPDCNVDQSEPMDLSRCKPKFSDNCVGLNLTKSPQTNFVDYKIRLGSSDQVPENLSVSSLESSQVAALTLDSPQVSILVFLLRPVAQLLYY